MGQVGLKHKGSKCNRLILSYLHRGGRRALSVAVMPRYSLKYSRRAARTAFLAFLLMLASRAFANNSKISPDLQALLGNPSSKINVIVQYNTPPQQSSGGLLGGLVGGVVNLVDGVLNTVFSLIPAVSATLHPADVLAVSNQSNVAYISLDRPLGASLDYTAAAVGAPSAWSYGLQGDGIGVAVINYRLLPSVW